MSETYRFEDFCEIIAALRAPDGCPWDRAQTFESLKPFLVSEAAETLAAVNLCENGGGAENFCEELGDVLLQVVLNSQIAAEEGLFTIQDVIRSVCEKMIRRHPHVFGERSDALNGGRIRGWDAIKQKEREHLTKEALLEQQQAVILAQQEMIAQLQKSLDKSKNSDYK